MRVTRIVLHILARVEGGGHTASTGRTHLWLMLVLRANTPNRRRPETDTAAAVGATTFEMPGAQNLFSRLS